MERREAEARRGAEEAVRRSQAAVEDAKKEAARLGEEARQTREKLLRLEEGKPPSKALSQPHDFPACRRWCPKL